ncbi:MAG TPA: hypothetical protein PKD72_01940, partial [Gemmatales bacterium]|nr:hypothetical protein [Gemmatales bacterium]
MRRAAELDAQSSLQAWAEYLYRQPGVVYLDGNSLGLLSKPAEAAVHQMLEAWKRYAIEGWIAGESPWFHLS